MTAQVFADSQRPRAGMRRWLATAARGRSLWLPFALLLALLVAAQCLAAAHWHDGRGQSDHDCALCALASVHSAVAHHTDYQFPVHSHTEFRQRALPARCGEPPRSCRNRGPPAPRH
jgi:hypothetical protein